MVLNDGVFRGIVSQRFVPEVDLFASRLNTNTDKSISWHPEPGAFGIDAFSLNWANMNCYAFPPFSLLPSVLTKIRSDQALVLLIAPVTVWKREPSLTSVDDMIYHRSLCFPLKITEEMETVRTLS